MRKSIPFLISGLLTCAASFGSPITVDVTQSGGVVSIALDPPGGILYGNPADTVGWGFDLSTDSNYGVAIEQSNFCPTTAACADSDYTDLIGYANGISDNPGDAPLEQDYSEANSTGFGSYVVQSAPVAGYLQLEYYLTSDAGGDPVANSDQTIYVAAEVAPNSSMPVSTPEPGALLLLTAGAGGFLVLRRRVA